jgi:demethylmenaquinone methyltransferase/2-methoxy-6-polyprenyl-1,4-benzoquinol methylase
MGTFEFNRRIENRIISRWLTVRKKGILDLACGNGAFSIEFALRENDVTGFDLDKESLKLGKKTGKSVGGNLNFVCGDALHLPFRDSTFEYVLCNCSIEHFKDDDKALEEMYRTLKTKGGAIITTDSFPLKISNSLRYIPRKLIRKDIDFGKGLRTALKEYHRMEYQVVNYYYAGDIIGKFERCGFRLLEYRYYINSCFSKMIFELHLLLKKLRFNSPISQSLFPLMYPFTFLDGTKKEGYGLAILVQK